MMSVLNHSHRPYGKHGARARSQTKGATLTVKKHIHNYLEEPIDNIEILCKNFPIGDTHTLEYIKKTKWQNKEKVLIIIYRRKKRIIGN